MKKFSNEEKREIVNQGEMLCHTITTNEQYNTCIDENTYILHDKKVYILSNRGFSEVTKSDGEFYNTEDIRSWLESKYPLVVEMIDANAPFGEKAKIREVLICGETKEEIVRAFFKKDNSLSYCNGHSVRLKDASYTAFYREYFFGDGGVSRYAEMGGNMD